MRISKFQHLNMGSIDVLSKEQQKKITGVYGCWSVTETWSNGSPGSPYTSSYTCCGSYNACCKCTNTGTGCSLTCPSI